MPVLVPFLPQPEQPEELWKLVINVHGKYAPGAYDPDDTAVRAMESCQRPEASLAAHFPELRKLGANSSGLSAVSGSAVVAATVESSSGVGAALEPPGSGTGSDVDGAALVSSSVARSRARPFLLAVGALNAARSSSSSWRRAPCFVRLPGDARTAGAAARASRSGASRISAAVCATPLLLNAAAKSRLDFCCLFERRQVWRSARLPRS